jgi:hypothetical protein
VSVEGLGELVRLGGRGADTALPVLDMVLRGMGMSEGIAPLLKGVDPARAKALREAAQSVRQSRTPAPPARPIPTSTPAMKQGELLTTKGAAQNFTGGRKPFVRSTDVPLTQTARGASEAPMATGRVRQAPGQTDLFSRTSPEPAFTSTRGPEITAPPVPYTPEALALAQSDPGTFNALRQMAAKAEDYYGITRGNLVNDLVAPGGTDVIRYLDQGMPLDQARAAARGALATTPGTQIAVPPAGTSRAMAAMPGGEPGALVRSPGGVVDTGESFTNIPVDVRVMDPDTMRSIAAARAANGGVQRGDLSKVSDFLKTPAGFGTALAGGALGAGMLARMFGGDQSVPTSAGTQGGGESTGSRVLIRDENGRPLGDTSATEAAATAAARMPASTDPSAPGRMIVTAGDGGASERRAALAQSAPMQAAAERALEPRDPSSYKNISDYYAARRAYAQNPAVANELANYAAQQFAESQVSEQLDKWAKLNPELVYEMQRRSMVNPAANQQSPESVTTSQVVTPMGSNNQANAVGNSEATADIITSERLRNALNGVTQQAYELRDATRPMEQPQLQRTQDLMRNSGAGRPLF